MYTISQYNKLVAKYLRQVKNFKVKDDEVLYYSNMPICSEDIYIEDGPEKTSGVRMGDGCKMEISAYVGGNESRVKYDDLTLESIKESLKEFEVLKVIKDFSNLVQI